VQVGDVEGHTGWQLITHDRLASMSNPRAERAGRGGSGWTEQDRRLLRDIGSSIRLAAFALVFMVLITIAFAVRIFAG
jgi:hypothetical protein